MCCKVSGGIFGIFGGLFNRHNFFHFPKRKALPLKHFSLTMTLYIWQGFDIEHQIFLTCNFISLLFVLCQVFCIPSCAHPMLPSPFKLRILISQSFLHMTTLYSLCSYISYNFGAPVCWDALSQPCSKSQHLLGDYCVIGIVLSALLY